jgi:hypothetical protein
MKKPRERKPRWYLLYTIVAAVVGVYFLETKLALSGTARMLSQLAVLFIASYFIYQWINSEMPFDNWS